MINTIFLRLEGPLQAWGERGRWSVRDTMLEPTKSGVIGLVACALGYKTDEQIRPLSQKTEFGVRIDAPGQIITDYHTIGGGYDYPTLLTAQGKPKKTSKGDPHTELSYRDYLCDASFLAALRVLAPADAPLIQQMAHALQNPVWPIFLGRKACIPARPVFAGTGNYGSLAAALSHHTDFTRYGRPHWQTAISTPFNLPLILESSEPTGTRRRDNIHSRQYRVFHPRYVVREQTPPLVIQKEENGHVSLQIAT